MYSPNAHAFQFDVGREKECDSQTDGGLMQHFSHADVSPLASAFHIFAAAPNTRNPLRTDTNASTDHSRLKMKSRSLEQTGYRRSRHL